MLQLRIDDKDNRLVYVSGYGFRQSVTRYAGEYWDRIASELLCGVADFVQDVGIVMVSTEENAQMSSVTSNPDRWLSLTSSKRSGKSVWHLSEAGWLFVPSCREAVEDVMAWSMPYLRGDEVTLGCRSIVFPEYTLFRELLDSKDWNTNYHEFTELINKRCLSTSLFEMTWSWATWTLYPRAMNLQHLLKLADQVVARIDILNTD